MFVVAAVLSWVRIERFDVDMACIYGLMIVDYAIGLGSKKTG